MAVTNDIIRQLSTELNLPSFKTRAYVRGITEIIGQALQEGDKIDLADFGSFKLLRLPTRTVETNFGGRHQTIKLNASITPDFVIDPQLQAKITPPATADPVDDNRPIDEQFRVSVIHNRKSDIGFIDLVGKVIPKEVLAAVPEPIARRYQAVPFAVKDKTLYIAMTDPENEEAFSAIRKSSGKILKPFITTTEDINTILDQYSALQAEMKELVKDSQASDVETAKEEEMKIADEDVDESSPAAKIVGTLLKRAVREKASDIHIEPTEETVEVRFRVDGILKKVLTLPKEIRPALTSRIKILANLKIDEMRLPQDGRIQIILDGNRIDFRISCLPTVNGEKIVARVLDRSGGVLTLDQLGVQGRQYTILEENIKKAHGMTLVTGPTGSGKSTTMYAIISRIKSETINIVTMEDPVEYRMGGVNQSQVNAAIGFSFANGLRSILRQDPDVVMVGEIRDRETADIAINAALTGHIVLSSLHTNDSAGAIPRLIDMGIEPFLITSSVNDVVAQRLCRKICDKCRVETEIKPEDSELIEQEIATLPNEERGQAQQRQTFYKGQGCEACSNTGYRGRIGIFEILSVTEPIKQLVLKRSTSSQLAELAKKEGLISMKQDGILKALAGLTTIEEVWRVTKD